jgi:hypothetical protein
LIDDRHDAGRADSGGTGTRALRGAAQLALVPARRWTDGPVTCGARSLGCSRRPVRPLPVGDSG